MTFDSRTFKEVNNKQNYIVKSRLYDFHSNVESSGLSIKLPQTGIEVYQVDGKEYKIKSGDFLLINKGQGIRVDLESKVLVESICIYLDSQMYTDIFQSLQSNNILDFAPNCSNNFVEPDKYFVEDCDLSSALTSIAAAKDYSSFTEEHFLLLTEKLAAHQIQQQNIMANINAHNYVTRQEMHKRLKMAKSFIFDNYNQNISLDEIANVSCLSKYHLLRTFKDAFCLTPYQALLERRIAVAKKELTKHNTIEEVAINCGFNDRRSFSRVFKKIVGHTPSNYQEKLCLKLSKVPQTSGAETCDGYSLDVSNSNNIN